MAKRHIWYMKATITVPATVWVAAETEEAKKRFAAGAWHKVVPDFDHCKEWEFREGDYAISKGPGINA